MCIGKGTSQIGNLFIGLQNLTNHHWNLAQTLNYPQIFITIYSTLSFRKREGKHSEHSYLTCKCFGRSDTNLRTYVNICTCIGGSRNTRADSITYSIYKSSLFLSQLNSSKCISRLATLTNGDYNIILSYNRITISEFRSILYFNRNPTESFDNLLSNKTCMP